MSDERDLIECPNCGKRFAQDRDPSHPDAPLTCPQCGDSFEPVRDELSRLLEHEEEMDLGIDGDDDL